MLKNVVTDYFTFDNKYLAQEGLAMNSALSRLLTEIRLNFYKDYELQYIVKELLFSTHTPCG